MGKSKKQNKGKRKTVPLVKSNCDKTLPLIQTEKVKAQKSSLSCPEKVPPCAESESCLACSGKDECAERKSQSKSVNDLGQGTRPVHDDPCLTSSQVELQSITKRSASTSSRCRSSRIKNVKREESMKFNSEVSALLPLDTCEGLSDIKDDLVQSCTEVKTEFGKLLIAACKQKLEDESENPNLAICGAERRKRKHVSSVKACKNFIRTSGSRIKQADALESIEETGKEEIVSSPKVVICPNDCLNLESSAKRNFRDDLKVKTESKKCSQYPEDQQDVKSVKVVRSSTSIHPTMAKNSSSIASFFAGFASHSAVEKDLLDLPQSCDSVSISRGIKEEGVISNNISLSIDVKDDASDVKEQEVMPSVSLIKDLSGTDLLSLTELPAAPASVPVAVPPCKRRHRSERKSGTKKRSVPAPLEPNPVDRSGGRAVLPQSISCKSTVVKTKPVKSVKSENKDGKNQIKTKIATAKDLAPTDTTAGAPILTRSMIKTPG